MTLTGIFLTSTVLGMEDDYMEPSLLERLRRSQELRRAVSEAPEREPEPLLIQKDLDDLPIDVLRSLKEIQRKQADNAKDEPSEHASELSIPLKIPFVNLKWALNHGDYPKHVNEDKWHYNCKNVNACTVTCFDKHCKKEKNYLNVGVGYVKDEYSYGNRISFLLPPMKVREGGKCHLYIEDESNLDVVTFDKKEGAELWRTVTVEFEGSVKITLKSDEGNGAIVDKPVGKLANMGVKDGFRILKLGKNCRMMQEDWNFSCDQIKKRLENLNEESKMKIIFGERIIETVEVAFERHTYCFTPGKTDFEVRKPVDQKELNHINKVIQISNEEEMAKKIAESNSEALGEKLLRKAKKILAGDFDSDSE